jgi:rhodanese-related sulfurtransferase
VTCRLGNDSKIGADALRKALVEERVADGLAGEEPKAAERTLEGKGRPAEGSGADVEGIGQAGAPLGERGPVLDLVGGLRAWSFQVDSTFPQY